MNLDSARAVSARFALDWFAGATAVIDVAANSDKDKQGQYTFRYGSPFRTTMRPPAQEVVGSDPEFDAIEEDLRRVAGSASQGARGAAAAPGAAPSDEALQGLVTIGKLLMGYVLPEYMREDLSGQDLFVEIGTDESLVPVPWELLRCGDEFVSLRHSIGRYVNMSRTPPQAKSRRPPRGELGELRVLLIAVPRPDPIEGVAFDHLPAAEAEGKAVMEVLAELGVRTDYVADNDATVAKVQRLLVDNSYHIIHFTGHASFKPNNPRASALILQNGAITANMLSSAYANQTDCVLSFINACETTRAGAVDPVAPPANDLGIDWDREYDIFGLARSFLDSGGYLLGSRWLLPDQPAETFAKSFYTSLLGDGVPVGTAIRNARRACFALDEADVSWASYIYYGDPRVYFRRLVEPGSGAGGAAVVAAGGTAVNGGSQSPGNGATPPGAAAGSSVEVAPGIAAAETVPEPARPAIDIELFRPYAERYETIRETMSPGPERTAEMTQVVFDLSGVIGTTDMSSVLDALLAGSPGQRIVGLTALQLQPDPAYLPQVMDAIENVRTPFEQYQALSVAYEMVARLNFDDNRKLEKLLRQMLGKEEFFGTDRAVIAQSILTMFNQSSLADSAVGNPPMP
jgi:hypothetical protein